MNLTEHPRREFLRFAAWSLAGMKAARGEGPARVAPIAERVKTLADEAPLAMTFRGQTAGECEAWQREFGAKLRALLGPFAPPTQWESVVERVVEFDDHVREERVLTAEGVPPLPVYLLRPRGGSGRAGAGKRPGVVAVHGHGEFGHDAVAGRDETEARRKEIAQLRYDYGRQLARRGYAVAAPCLTPFGRRRSGGAGGGAAAGGTSRGNVDVCTTTFVALQALGRLLIAENLRDVLWSLDLLAAHPGVDADRLGCVGLSYGGRMTMFAAAVEPRIKVAVVSGALNCLQERVATGHAAGCQTVPGLLAFGDVPEVASLVAPRPCLWEVGSRDALLPPEWVDAALVRIGRAYRALGAEDALRVDRFDGAHEWHGAAAYPLLDRVLKA